MLQTRWDRVVVVLWVITLLGAAVRLADVPRRSISHPEMWVPLIPISEEIAAPGQRKTLPALLRYNTADTHPPGYYVLMWFWMKLFGSSIWAIRLPSVLLGVATIPLVYLWGVRIGQRKAGLIASALLALNGPHVFWSQLGRMYALICFLAVFSALTLLYLSEREAPRWLQPTYVIVVLGGLASHVFFWPVLLAQMLWVAALASIRRQPPCRSWDLQVLTLILGSPLLALAAYQSQNQVAILSADAGSFVLGLLQFAFLLPANAPEDGPASMLRSEWLWSGRAVALVVALACLAVAFRMLRGDKAVPLAGERRRMRTRWLVWTACAAGSTLLILAFAYAARAAGKREALVILAARTAVVPFVLTGLGLLADRNWHRFTSLTARFIPAWLAAPAGLVWICAAVPMLIVALLSLARPLLNQRGLLIATPFVLLVLSVGLARMSWPRPWLVATVSVLALLHAGSVFCYSSLRLDPADFQLLASRLVPRTQPTDIFLLRRSWDTTPLLYYLRPDRYHIVVRGGREELERSPQARVWELSVYNKANPPELKQALEGYKAIDEVQGPHLRAVLFVPVPGLSRPPAAQ